MSTISVLLVEDDEVDFESIQRQLSCRAYDANKSCQFVLSRVLSVQSALEFLQSQSVDAILLDLSLPDSVGLDGLHRLAKSNYRLPIVVLTGTDNEEMSLAALEEGAQDYLVKGAPAAAVVKAIRYAIQRQHLVQKLEIAEANASQATQAKSMFLATMSHEIRTPLTSIIGYTETALAEVLSPEEEMQALRSILRNGQHLLSIINDILDLSKIEADKLELEMIEIPVFEVFQQIEETLRPLAADKGLALAINYLWPLPRTLHTDPTRLRQTLFNLVNNAIKFTKDGSITLNVSYSVDSSKLLVEVRDTGIGMSEQQRSTLFQAFTQADVSTTRKFGGTGLGLVIANTLATKLGGGITLESEVGVGSTFKVEILSKSDAELLWHAEPVDGPVVNESLHPEVSQTRLRGKVLLVEDGIDNQQFISFILRKIGLSVEVKDNGRRGVEAALTDEFDLVLMDMRMPVMDGYRATQVLRGCGYTRPIVALTANAMNDDVARCLQVGCSDFIGKPFKREVFLTKISALLAGAGRNVQGLEDSARIAPTTLDPELQGVFQQFLANLPTRIEKIQEALKERHWEELSMLAHRLKGAAGNYQLMDISNVSGRLECICGAQDGEQALAFVEQLSQLAQRSLGTYRHNRELESEATCH